MSRLTSHAFAVLALAALTFPFCAGTAMAKPLDSGTFHDEFTETFTDFCEVSGLTVELFETVDGTFRIGSKGKAGIPFYTEHTDFRQVFTNVESGKSASTWESTIIKDLEVVDNGDGTSTVLVLATGNYTIYGSNGKAIARNPGQVRYRILIDNAGTPADPSDDEFLEFLGFTKESTGRNSDFCAAVVPAIS